MGNIMINIMNMIDINVNIMAMVNNNAAGNNNNNNNNNNNGGSGSGGGGSGSGSGNNNNNNNNNNNGGSGGGSGSGSGNNNNNNNMNGRSLETFHNPFLVNERRKRDLSEDFLDYQSLFELEYLLRKHLPAGQTSSNITDTTLVQLPGKQLSRYLFKQIENSVDQVTRSCAETDQQTDICQIVDSILF